MKLNNIIAKLIEKHSVSKVLEGVLETQPWDKLLLTLANQCVYISNSSKNKKEKNKWYGLGRLFHRARDEMVLKTKPFKISRRDVYECSKCEKRFPVDATRELNAKFDASDGLFIVSCPSCGLAESKK